MPQTRMIVLGRVAHEAHHKAGLRQLATPPFAELRPSTRRLWRVAAEAIADREQKSALEAGANFYAAWLEATGLPVEHFMNWKDLCSEAKMQWMAAAVAVMDAMLPLERHAQGQRPC